MHSCVTCGVVLATGSDTELTPKLSVSSKLLNQFIFRITSTIIFILLYKFDEIFTGSSGHILCGYLLSLLSLTARLSLFINITA